MTEPELTKGDIARQHCLRIQMRVHPDNWHRESMKIEDGEVRAYVRDYLRGMKVRAQVQQETKKAQGNLL